MNATSNSSCQNLNSLKRSEDLPAQNPRHGVVSHQLNFICMNGPNITSDYAILNQESQESTKSAQVKNKQDATRESTLEKFLAVQDGVIANGGKDKLLLIQLP